MREDIRENIGEDIRKISALFSERKEFNGWMIIKLHFQTEETIVLDADIQKMQKREIRETAFVLRKKKNYALLGLLWKQGFILMHLWNPKFLAEHKEDRICLVEHKEDRICSAKHKTDRIWQDKTDHSFCLPKNCRKVGSKVFSKEEILEFTEKVQDHNWIHQTEKQIVPGFMMVEWLWDIGELSLWNKMVVFRAPAYVWEEIELYIDSFYGYYFAITKGTEGNIRLLWEVKEIGNCYTNN